MPSLPPDPPAPEILVEGGNHRLGVDPHAGDEGLVVKVRIDETVLGS
ncbi:MAG: hypothetical protein ACKO22_03075 [Cyanobium sp.]